MICANVSWDVTCHLIFIRARTKWPKWKQRQNFIFLHLASDYNGLGLRLKIQLLQLIYENVRSWCTWSIFKFETAGCSVQLIRKYYIVAFNGLLTHRVIAFQSQFSQERMRWAWHGVGRNQLPKNSPFQTHQIFFPAPWPIIQINSKIV